MRANRGGRNESLSRVSDEMIGFQVSPHAQMWIMATGPWAARVLAASAVKMCACVVYEEEKMNEVQGVLCGEAAGMSAVSCHAQSRACASTPITTRFSMSLEMLPGMCSR